MLPFTVLWGLGADRLTWVGTASEQWELGFCVLRPWPWSGWLVTEGRTLTALLYAFPFLSYPFCLYCKVGLGTSISDRKFHVYRSSGEECRSQPKY